MTQRSTFAGLTVTSLGTLLSRVLGLARDMATAALLGLAGGGVMDAFVIAFRIPNLFRRLFGEGALAASYLPVLSRTLLADRDAAWRLASSTLLLLGFILAGVLLLAEGACGVLWWLRGDEPGYGLVLGLTAVMLPYLWLICVAAQVSATLNALSHFSLPALAPALLNIGWLIGAWVAARWFPDAESRAYVLAIAIVLAGVEQLLVQWPVLRRYGFHWDLDWRASRAELGEIARAMVPMLLGLAVTQINTIIDSLMAWGLTDPGQGSLFVPWLPGHVLYPFRQGAASALYFAERLYQFPLGMLGMAVATVIFPVLSRHAAQGDRAALADDLSAGLRLVLFWGVPAGVGLIVLADPIASAFFQRGEFTAADAQRMARVIACYGYGVWAFCAMPVIVRGYYALGDRITPLRTALAAVVLNVLLNLTLMWWCAEAGLAAATVISSTVQVVVLARLFSRVGGKLDWPSLRRAAGRTALASAIMAGAGGLTVGWVASAGSGKLLSLGLPLAASLLAFFAVAGLLRAPELAIFSRRDLR